MTDETIRLTADVVAIAPDADGLEHVLLIRRRWEPYADHWALPGGHVDEGEAVAAAAARELAEETGLAVTADALTELGAWHAPGRDPRGRYVTVAYRASVAAEVQLHAADDATDARWWPADQIADLPIAFDHRAIIRAALTPMSDETSQPTDDLAGQIRQYAARLRDAHRYALDRRDRRGAEMAHHALRLLDAATLGVYGDAATCGHCRCRPVERYGEPGLHGERCAECVDLAITDGHTCPTCQH